MDRENKIKVTSFIIILIITSFVCSFISYNAGLGDGMKEVVIYIEDCTIERAYAGKCSIPCSIDSDCIIKNGNRDNY